MTTADAMRKLLRVAGVGAWFKWRPRRSGFDRFDPPFEAAMSSLLNLPQCARLAERSCGQSVGGLQQLRKHIRDGGRPRFFSDLPALAAAARSLARTRPQWRDRTLDRVLLDRQEGLLIYENRGPVLDAAFPWGSVPPGPGSDILQSVRPHRFAFAPRWALAILYGAPLAGELLRIVESWMQYAASESNKLAYLSNLVVIQRVLAMSWAWAFVAACECDDDEHQQLELRILQILSADLAFLQPRLGDSYPNNHLLVDRFARWFASAVWPEFVPDAKLRVEHEKAWLAEWARQTLPDGAGFEHAQHYHEFACEMAIAYVALSRRNRWPVDDRDLDRLHAMLRFEVDVNGGCAVPLAFGNATEDPLFPLDSGEGWGSAAWADVLRAWFEPDCRAPNDSAMARERAFWLLGEDWNGAPLSRRESPACSSALVYLDGGIIVLPDSDGTSRLVLRTGPAPGRRISAGHAHADLLSVFVDVADVPILVDAGTFSYRGARAPWSDGEPEWRRYFAGPKAHNGLDIAGVDPLGGLEGDFRGKDSSAFVELMHCNVSGRLRRVEGVVHGGGPYGGYRRGVVHVQDEFWLVYDIVPSVGVESASFGFQAAPEAAVQTADGWTTEVLCESARLRIGHTVGLSAASIQRGQIAPPAGWVSRAYGSKLPAAQMRFGWDGECPITAFVLTANDRPHPREIEAIPVAGSGYAFRLRFDDRLDHVLVSSTAAQAELSAFGVRFSGAVAWCRVGRDGVGRLCWADGRYFENSTIRVRAADHDGLAVLDGRIDAEGFHWADGLGGEVECESWKKSERSPNQ